MWCRSAKHPGHWDDDELLLGASNVFGTSVAIYRGSATTLAATKVGSTPVSGIPFSAAAIFDTSEKTALVVTELLDPDRFHLYFSTNLVSWQGPFFLGEFTFNGYLISVEGKGSTMVATVLNPNNQPDEFFMMRSSNGGQTWSPMPGHEDVIYVQVLTEQLLFALVRQPAGDVGTISKLAKSTDGGSTWTLENALFYGDRISFFDALNGVATAGPTLQITEDGGKTWKLILAPAF